MAPTVSEFDQFWSSFPRRVGKLAAMAAFQRARRTATAEDILAGVDRYRRAKPAYADWCHPTTWLNQGRWLDEEDLVEPVAVVPPWKCPHEFPCSNREMCASATFLKRPLKSVAS